MRDHRTECNSRSATYVLRPKLSAKRSGSGNDFHHYNRHHVRIPDEPGAYSQSLLHEREHDLRKPNSNRSWSHSDGNADTPGADYDSRSAS